MSRSMQKPPATRKQLLLGCAMTGAKYTSHNHKTTGDPILDFISSGGAIPNDLRRLAAEIAEIHQAGCRYIHLHARDPETGEQTCDPTIYHLYGIIARQHAPDALLSFGASRNGPQVGATVANEGEWARVRQAAEPLGRGGAHFVTTQAAIELQVARDMQRQGYVAFDEETGDYRVLKDLSGYVPSRGAEKIDLGVHSTEGGRDYGASSAAVQHMTMRQVIRERLHLGLPFEVEWIQNAASRFLTEYTVHTMVPGIAEAGRLNITILFGFSAKLPFPESYEDFRRVVEHARAVGNDRLKVSVTCGAAILPKRARLAMGVIDVGPMAGMPGGPAERLIAWASQPDSGVDAVRVGLEDTPFMLSTTGDLLPVDNPGLIAHAVTLLRQNRAELITSAESVSDWLAQYAS